MPATPESDSIISGDTNNGDTSFQNTIAEMPITLIDHSTGSIIRVFESVANPNWVATDINRLKAYVAPLGILIIPATLTPLQRPKNVLEYRLELLCYHTAMMEQAEKAITELYTKPERPFKATPSNVHVLTHQKVTFEVRGMDFAKVSPIGSLDKDLSLPSKLPISINIPSTEKEYFESQLKSLQVDMTIYYRARPVAVSSIALSSTKLTQAANQMQLFSGGAAFVDADKVANLVRNVAESQSAIILQDPDIPAQLSNRVNELFDRMLANQPSKETERKYARELEKYYLRGTGLELTDFQPITAMWEICDDLNTATKFTDANQKLQEYYNKDTNRDKINAGGSFGFGPWSASLNGEKEMTSENVKNGYFANQQEYDDFRSHHKTSKGLEPRITARGLKLVEKEAFQSAINQSLSSIAFYPISEIRRILISVPTISSDSLEHVQVHFDLLQNLRKELIDAINTSATSLTDAINNVQTKLSEYQTQQTNEVRTSSLRAGVVWIGDRWLLQNEDPARALCFRSTDTIGKVDKRHAFWPQNSTDH